MRRAARPSSPRAGGGAALCSPTRSGTRRPATGSDTRRPAPGPGDVPGKGDAAPDASGGRGLGGRLGRALSEALLSLRSRPGGRRGRRVQPSASGILAVRRERQRGPAGCVWSGHGAVTGRTAQAPRDPAGAPGAVLTTVRARSHTKSLHHSNQGRLPASGLGPETASSGGCSVGSTPTK